MFYVSYSPFNIVLLTHYVIVILHPMRDNLAYTLTLPESIALTYDFRGQ